MATTFETEVKPVELRIAPDNAENVAAEGLASQLLLHAAQLPSARENIDWLLHHPDFSSRHALALLDSGFISLDELGHRQDSLPLLEVLVQRFAYPEAILTLGKRYFTNPSETVETLAAFLGQQPANEWLLEALAHEEPSSTEKDQAYRASLKNFPAILKKAIELQQSRQRQQAAATATTLDEIQKLFATGDPAALRVLAANRHTPAELLEQLAALQGVKFAREIRSLARDTLLRRARKPGVHG